MSTEGQRGEVWVGGQALLGLVYVLVPQVGPHWWPSFLMNLAGWALTVAGAGLLLWSSLKLGRAFTPFPRPVAHGRLVTTGVYGWVRHPIYFAVLLGALGIALLTQSWLRLALTAVLLLFFDRKASREEHWLQEQYPGYADYRSRVRKLIPGIY